MNLTTMVALAALGCAACGGATAIGPASDASSDAAVTADYTMDFTQFPKGGLYSGNMYNVVFGLNLQQRVRLYDVPVAFGQIGMIPPNVAVAEVLGFFCQTGKEKQLESDLARPGNYNPAAGDTAWIDHVDLDMIPDSIQDVPPDGKGVIMCFGTRSEAGVWQWDLSPRLPAWNSNDKTFILRIPIQRGPVDAVEVVSSGGGGSGLHVRIRRIIVATVPGGG